MRDDCGETPRGGGSDATANVVQQPSTAAPTCLVRRALDDRRWPERVRAALSAAASLARRCSLAGEAESEAETRATVPTAVPPAACATTVSRLGVCSGDRAPSRNGWHHAVLSASSAERRGRCLRGLGFAGPGYPRPLPEARQGRETCREPRYASEWLPRK